MSSITTGYAMDPCTRQEFVGPYYMPWTVLKLELLVSILFTGVTSYYVIDQSKHL